MSNPEIKLYKQLIAITKNKSDKAELVKMLKQTEDEEKGIKQPKKQKAYNIKNVTATKAKSLGFKTKKS